LQIRIRKGLDIPVAGAPEQRIETGPAVSRVALLGRDYLGLRPKLVVQVGDRVRLGQALFSDRGDPRIRWTAPGAGSVVAIERGPRRALQAVVLALDGDEAESFPAWPAAQLATLERDSVRDGLLKSGLWTALRQRPFARIPAADTVPHSIFVTAIDTNPLAAEPRLVIMERVAAFVAGLTVLSRLTPGAVYVCQGPGEELPMPNLKSMVAAHFSGPHPAGLPGTHIHFLDPVGERKTVWYLNYQDVLAMGELFTTGRLPVDRVIALAGPHLAQPRLLRTRLGASTEELLRGELLDGPTRVVSGSLLAGQQAAGWARYLGRYDLSIAALPEGQPREFLAWIMPGLKKYSSIRAYAAGWLPQRTFPLGNFEKVMPLDILPAPLLKALLVRDTDAARALGCLELDAEDLALCTFVCCSKYDYGAALRENLDAIEKDS
jgi:Na+-transporting NADH:ubiquinone oxidoreductase subunit A